MPPTARIRAVSFDVGGTLIEPWPSVGHVYAGVAERFGMAGIPPESLNRRFAAAWKARINFNYSREAWRELVNRSFAGLSPEFPSHECFDAMYEIFATAAPWRIFDDVRPAIAEVGERGWKLAIISNWDERLCPLLRELELLDCFDVVVISHEAGFTKPVPEIFHRAASLLDCTPETILHIGDSAAEDYDGARSAGMRSLLLDRNAGQAGQHLVSTLAAAIERFQTGAVRD